MLTYVRKSGYCLQDKCEKLSYEFHMTKLRSSMSFPLDVDKDNMYSRGKNDADTHQCSVIVKRQGDEPFHAEGYNGKNERKGEKDDALKPNGDPLIVKGLPRDLAILSTGSLGDEVKFNYGAHDFGYFDIREDFF